MNNIRPCVRARTAFSTSSAKPRCWAVDDEHGCLALECVPLWFVQSADFDLPFKLSTMISAYSRIDRGTDSGRQAGRRVSIGSCDDDRRCGLLSC